MIILQLTKALRSFSLFSTEYSRAYHRNACYS